MSETRPLLPDLQSCIGPGLGAYEMTRGDQKDFTANGWKVGIAVLEVTDTEPVLKVADDARLGSGDGLTIFF